MPYGVLFRSGGYLGCTHVENEMKVFVSMGCRTFHEILLFMFRVTPIPPLYVLFQLYHS